MMTEAQIFVNALYRQECLFDLMALDDYYFEHPDSKKLFKILKELYDANEHIDLPVLFTKLKSENINIEGAYLEYIIKGIPSINNSFLIRSIIDRDKKKNVMAVAKDLFLSVQKGIDYNEFIHRLIEIDMNVEHDNDGCDISKLPADLDEIFHSNNYIKTGLIHLDSKINGFFNGQLIVIAGRPKRGKTTLAITIMKNIKVGVLFFSLEMKREEIYAKILAGDSNVESWKIESKKTNSEEKERILKAHLSAIQKYKMKVYDEDININRIISIVKRDRKKYRIVFIDYLQLIPGGQGDNQNLRISQITRDLKLLAHSLNIPIVLISQLNRDSSKENRKPELSDLRDSGTIEQNADIIIFTHETKDKETQIIIGGNRKGSEGVIKGIQFVKEYSRFDDEIDI